MSVKIEIDYNVKKFLNSLTPGRKSKYYNEKLIQKIIFLTFEEFETLMVNGVEIRQVLRANISL